MAARRSMRFDPNIDPAFLSLVEGVAGGYSPYDVELFSGRAARPTNPSSFHPRGGAIDFNLIDRATGQALPNIRDPASARAYQQFANAVYQAADPALRDQLRWGGYFKSGVPKDWMHLDIGGAKNMAAGSWAGGFGPELLAELGLKDAGGIAALDQAMQQAGYTPEQRRNAIASLESAGSGDYGALGPATGEDRDRAYGRYQVMGKNVGPWAEQYLKMTGVTPQRFLGDPKLQDQLFDAVFGSYVGKYGEEGAARAWFGGEGNIENVLGEDMLGTKIGDYGKRYLQALGGAGSTPAAASTGTAAASTSPYSLPAKTPLTTRDKLANAVKEMGQSFGGSSGWRTPELPAQPGAANVQAEPRPMVDAQAAEARRQQLALAMQRLNQGVLF